MLQTHLWGSQTIFGAPKAEKKSPDSQRKAGYYMVFPDFESEKLIQVYSKLMASILQNVIFCFFLI